jgi:hypothetical protein
MLPVADSRSAGRRSCTNARCLTADRHTRLALTRATPARPEDRRIRREWAIFLCDHLIDALLEVLRDDGGERDVARLALDHDATKPPAGSEISDAERRDRPPGACRCGGGREKLRRRGRAGARARPGHPCQGSGGASAFRLVGSASNLATLSPVGPDRLGAQGGCPSTPDGRILYTP